jgi:cytochrome o ubiquinol oxidase subunit 2
VKHLRVKTKKMNRADKVALFSMFLLGLGLLIAIIVSGNNIALLNPKGFIASEQRDLLVFGTAFILLGVIPAVALTFFTAWKFRASNNRAAYSPEAEHGKWFVLTMWMIPTVFMIVLGAVMWQATHSLEPRKPIASDSRRLTIQVVALRWKWLFIYPEQNVATVNYVQIPVDTPVEFQLTADEAPMSAFWVPNLGGMLYAMTGHVNRLNLIAGTPGDYPGQSAEINGAGFSEMKFSVKATSGAEFEGWLNTVKQSQLLLPKSEYEELAEPGEKHPVTYYSSVEQDLYNGIVMKYMRHDGGGSHDGQTGQTNQHPEH